MQKEKIQSTIYPTKQISYNQWCKKFKVGSRVEKRSSNNFYEDGEYDYNKFIKMIKNYGIKKQSNIWKQTSKTFLLLFKRQMQKAWNKINFA